MQVKFLHNTGGKSEHELLRLVAGGDEHAFRILFRNYYRKLGGYIIRLTQSKEHAEEIVQDSFVKIWNNRQALTEVENFNAYLFTVARNQALNVLKKLAREKLQQKLWVAGQDADPSIEAESPALLNELTTKLEAGILQLPQRQQQVFLLSRQEGLTHSQVAERLGISPASVKKHMVLALRNLRNFLGDQYMPIYLALYLYRNL